ncbi:membrane protein [Streptomyces sp. Y2F8-2]|uniref:PspC domain-containing protein n=1 Tax=Streptomyces sp. Y2F8-2 TaxID=2759675 RepID=UPI0019055DA2|nr:PspC domain-containing protein [Streptomyces sp. Y2F8-2]GHK00531.1 membrane protein [Streptomyces sp. Y2F8-2]
MTDQQHAAAGHGPGAGHASTAGRCPGGERGGRPPGDGAPDAAPQHAVPASGPAAPAADEEPRAQGGADVRQDAAVRENGGEDAGMDQDAGGPPEPGARTGAAARERAGAGKDTPGRGGTATSDHAAVAEDPGRFRRERRHKMLAGVCSGLARQCDMDPVIFRIVLAVLSAAGGLGLIFYGFVWLLVPYEDEEENEIRKLLTGRVDGQALAAVLFALVGCGIFLSMLRNGSVLTFAAVLSLLLAGAAYWSRQRGAPDADPLTTQAVADAPPEATAPPVPASYPSWWREPIVKDGTHVGGTGYLWGPTDTAGRDVAAAVAIARGSSYAERIRTEQRHRPRGPRWIGGWVFLLALLAGGLGTLLTWDDRALGTSLQTGLACALVVFGVGIAVSSFLGRTGAGSVFLAVLTAALLAASAALPKDIGTQWRHATWAPASVAAVREKYDLGTGVGTLDLSRLRLAGDQTVTTRARVGVGQLKVLVPREATVELNIDTGVGDIRLPGETRKDVDVKPGKHRTVTLTPAAGTKKAATLRLDLEVGVGQVEVDRAAS